MLRPFSPGRQEQEHDLHQVDLGAVDTCQYAMVLLLLLFCYFYAMVLCITDNDNNDNSITNNNGLQITCKEHMDCKQHIW